MRVIFGGSDRNPVFRYSTSAPGYYLTINALGQFGVLWDNVFIAQHPDTASTDSKGRRYYEEGGYRYTGATNPRVGPNPPEGGSSTYWAVARTQAGVTPNTDE